MSKTAPSGFMDHIPKGYYTRQQVAQKLGKSKDTIIRWHEQGVYVPTEPPMEFGEIKVWVYTDADIDAMRKIAKTMRPGPKPQSEVD